MATSAGAGAGAGAGSSQVLPQSVSIARVLRCVAVIAKDVSVALSGRAMLGQRSQPLLAVRRSRCTE